RGDRRSCAVEQSGVFQLCGDRNRGARKRHCRHGEGSGAVTKATLGPVFSLQLEPIAGSQASTPSGSTAQRNKLLGQNVLLSFISGRYYRPRLEERVLLFIDMEGSTGLAERLGPLAFHRLLNRFVTDLTDPIVAARGEIYSYVGDELIA